jgi:hypothetical protein
MHRLDAIARAGGSATLVQNQTYNVYPLTVSLHYILIPFTPEFDINLQDTCVQHNDFDCGVWVLVTIATLLLGHTHNTVIERRKRGVLKENSIDITEMREFFCSIALQAPLAT